MELCHDWKWTIEIFSGNNNVAVLWCFFKDRLGITEVWKYTLDEKGIHLERCNLNYFPVWQFQPAVTMWLSWMIIFTVNKLFSKTSKMNFANNLNAQRTVARETFPETLEVMSYVYQLWRHSYTTNDVTSLPETFPTQLCPFDYLGCLLALRNILYWF